MNIEKVYIPPIKIQGKKSKLVGFISENLPFNEFDTWIEPFMGSGVVGFNIRPQKAIFADSNPHIINFYNAIKNKSITPTKVKSFLEKEGLMLSEKGQDYYNEVRKRFNQEHNSLDFLFLNRSCFNGMIRFNRKLQFNVPYCHKPERFAQAYITKIVNQVFQVQQLIQNNDWQFICQDFRDTINCVKDKDLIYCDPPYIGRHVDYYDSWTEQDEIDLKQYLISNKSQFLISTWHSNQYRTNTYLQNYWNDFYIKTHEHFYFLGGKEENRNPMKEALIMNYDVILNKQKIIENKLVLNEQLSLNLITQRA